MKVRNPSRLKMIHLSRIVDFTNFPVLPYHGDAAATMSEAIHSLQCVKDSTPPRDLQYCHVLWSRTIVFQQFHPKYQFVAIQYPSRIDTSFEESLAPHTAILRYEWLCLVCQTQPVIPTIPLLLPKKLESCYINNWFCPTLIIFNLMLD